jgi:ketosteroid isomerase-like protein
LSAEDLAAVREADDAYAAAWLTNNPEQVMATLTANGVIVPSGNPASEGPEAVRSFWWPIDSPPATVTRFDQTQHEVGGSADMAFVRGSFVLVFEWEGDEYTGRGEYMSLFKREEGGSWRISHRMWSDSPTE